MLTHHRRDLIEAAIRNRAEITADEAANLLAAHDRLVEQLAAVTGQRNELDRRVTFAVSGLSVVDRDDPVEEYGRAIDQALADLRGER